ncbi:hypothetical protein MKEN_01311800 [Mycena kentingensis (nom. inval.)]|nr:hypothetical protein MKEN_01311800 [Mycena kentingensis (nom. inval.)]
MHSSKMRMFPPFTDYNQFFPGLILWCDPSSYESVLSTLPPGEEYDRRKAREPKPCLVVAVDHTQRLLQVARICASTPRDTRKWVRLDSNPAINWRVPDGWIWVGKPGTTKMLLNDARYMHPHKDASYSTNPIASSNLQNYWTHRQNYLKWRQAQPDTAPTSPSGYAGPSTSTSIYAAAPSASAYPYTGVGGPPPASYHTLSAQPVVVPAGFTDRHPSFPGWWRNPTTGWFWSPSSGLVPPP